MTFETKMDVYSGQDDIKHKTTTQEILLLRQHELSANMIPHKRITIIGITAIRSRPEGVPSSPAINRVISVITRNGRIGKEGLKQGFFIEETIG